MVAQRQELATRESFNFTPRTLEEAQQYATIIANSGICPENFKGRPNDVLIVLQMGSELNLKPMQALRSLGAINGMPFAYGDGLLALVKRHPAFENMKEWTEGNLQDGSLIAFCKMSRKGHEPVIGQFSIEDAKRAGLWTKKGVWQLYPKRMLQHRARNFAARDAFPDAVFGLLSEDEAKGVAETQTISVTKPKGKGMSGLEESLGLQDEIIEGELVTETVKSELESVNMIDELLILISDKNVPEKSQQKWCKQFNVENITDIPTEGIEKIIKHLKEKA